MNVVNSATPLLSKTKPDTLSKRVWLEFVRYGFISSF